MSNYGFCKMGSQPVTETRTYGPTHQPLTGASQSGRPNTESKFTATPLFLVSSSSGLTPTAYSLTCGSNGSVEVSHQYDALGRRVARTAGGSTTIFVQAGQQTIADYVAGAAPASSTYRYVYASYIDEPILRWQTSGSTAVYYHRNQQYSVTALTDSTGSVLERYAYSAYGVPTIANASGTVLTASAHNNRYMYTGREWDNDIQQYHYRARMYDAGLGRFCSRDPIPAFSLYLMLYGSPLNWMDWNGEKPHVNDLGQITPTKESDCLDNFNKGSQLCMMLPTHADRTKCFKDNETQYQDCVKKFHPNRPNKKHLTETNLCLCPKSKAERESPIPGATVLPIGSYPGGPSGGGHTQYPFPATPPAPIGGGGADPCIVVVVKCGDSVTVFHFSPSNNPGGTISQYSWGSDCSAIICAGNDEFQSNCLAKEAIQAVGNAGITLVGISSSSACGVTATGGWYVGG